LNVFFRFRYVIFEINKKDTPRDIVNPPLIPNKNLMYIRSVFPKLENSVGDNNVMNSIELGNNPSILNIIPKSIKNRLNQNKPLCL